MHVLRRESLLLSQGAFGQSYEPTGTVGPASLRHVLFEVSWEVCNQVGGIYQVVRSKAATMVERWRTRYYLVGPYVPGKAELEFEPLRPAGWIGHVIETLAEQGLVAHHGRWALRYRPGAKGIRWSMPPSRSARRCAS
jgi:hypothetical protein